MLFNLKFTLRNFKLTDIFFAMMHLINLHQVTEDKVNPKRFGQDYNVQL